MSADYHAKMSQSLFNHYNNLAAGKDNDNLDTSTDNTFAITTIAPNPTANPTINNSQPNQSSGMMSLLTPNIQEYRTNGLYDDGDDEDLGYFSSRAAVSVPSSRIDTTINLHNQHNQQFIPFLQKQDQSLYFNEQVYQVQGNQIPQIPPHQLSTSELLHQPKQELLHESSQHLQQEPLPHQELLQLQQQPQQTPQQHMLHQQHPLQQNYGDSLNFKEPLARPQPQRQYTAPVYSLSAKNLQQQQQQQQQLQQQLQQQQQQHYHQQQQVQQQQQLLQHGNPSSRPFNSPSGYYHQRAESMSFDTKPKIKKGTRPKKKPGFHLKLDGLRKVTGPTITSSQSDSGTDYWNRTPGGHSKLNLSFTPQLMHEQQHELGISEHDSEINDQNFTVPSFNLTPSVDPPGSGPNGYFELNSQTYSGNTNSNTNSNTTTNRKNKVLTPGVSNLGVSSGGFFSPAINDNAVNYFNQTFEEYLQDEEKLSSTIENIIAASHTTDLQQDSLDTDFTDLNIPDGQHLLAPLNFDNSLSNEFLSPDNDTVDSQSKSVSNEMTTPHYYNNSVGGGDEETPDQFTDNNLGLPVIQKTLSNQSGHSFVSVGSELTRSTSTNPNAGATPPGASTTTKHSKKRVSKGAVCTVCDKFISRDIARHMRIHDDVGRFQCVYPKAMCNHRTQNFNRPYDYKKHLLHLHFVFDDPKGKMANTLTDKLPIHGTCSACGKRFVASDWLDLHVLTKDSALKCKFINK